jgi:hypothetical protein
MLDQKVSYKFNLSVDEKKLLREQKMKQIEIINLSIEEIQKVLHVSFERARELFALSEFQQIPSIGIRFADDLLFLNYYTLLELKDKDGATLTDDYELKKGYWIDPCVEDQFRLVVHFANHFDYSKRWWDFTAERKQFRTENGYPDCRPIKSWVEVIGIKKK